MAYPALPTSTKSSTFDILTEVKKGDTFFLRGYEYIAYGDANVQSNRLHIDAGRKNTQMKSGFELASVTEYRPS